MSRAARPLYVLVSLWRRGDAWTPAPAEAQALEYAARMGEAALWRNYRGGDRSRRRLELELQRQRAAAGRHSWGA